MKIKNRRGDRMLTSLRGKFIVQAGRAGVPHIQSWPKKRGPHKDPAQKERVNWFVQVTKHASRMDPLERAAAEVWSFNQPYTWRDMAVMAAYGRLIWATLEDGQTLTGMRMPDTQIGRLLKQLGNVSGMIVYHDGEDWAALGRGAANSALVIDETTLLPAWQAGGGGGGGSAWELDTYYDGAVDGAVDTIDSGDLAGAHDVLVLFKDLTASSSGKRLCRVSLDGSAFLDSVGDYQEQYAAGTTAVNDGMFMTTSSTSGARSGHLLLDNIAAETSFITGLIRNRAQAVAMIGGTGPIRKVQIVNTGSSGGARKGQLNGGEAWIYKR